MGSFVQDHMDPIGALAEQDAFDRFPIPRAKRDLLPICSFFLSVGPVGERSWRYHQGHIGWRCHEVTTSTGPSGPLKSDLFGWDFERRGVPALALTRFGSYARRGGTYHFFLWAHR